MNTAIAQHFFTGTLHQIRGLLKDVPDERWAEQPAGIRNHPAWTVGHLCCGHHFALTILGQDSGVPEAWLQTMNMGTTPVADRSAYPPSAKLLEQFRVGHAKVDQAVHAMGPDDWTRENPVEGARTYFPTVGHALGYFLMAHEQVHLGQLIAWKRAAGLAEA